MILVHSGPLQQDKQVHPPVVTRGIDDCHISGKYSLSEAYSYLAKRTRPDLDSQASRRKHVLQPSWVDACITAGKLLDEDNMRGYEIR